MVDMGIEPFLVSSSTNLIMAQRLLRKVCSACKADVRLLRDNVVLYNGKVGSLRRFKDDVGEVKQGFECGIGIASYNDIKEGDVIEFYVTYKVAVESL